MKGWIVGRNLPLGCKHCQRQRTIQSILQIQISIAVRSFKNSWDGTCTLHHHIVFANHTKVIQHIPVVQRVKVQQECNCRKNKTNRPFKRFVTQLLRSWFGSVLFMLFHFCHSAKKQALFENNKSSQLHFCSMYY